MIGSFLIALLTTVQLWLGGLVPSAFAQQVAEHQVRVAQAEPPSAATSTNRVVTRVQALVKDRRAAAARKDAVAQRQQAQLAEIDRLKQRRASWRRDRQLKTQLAESQQTATELAALDRRLREIDRTLQNAHRQLLRAIETEVRLAPPTMARRRVLGGWMVASRRALQRTKKIVLPDYQIDPLADPEDLEFQAQRIAESERELEAEIAELIARAQRYDRMVKLREKAARASELSGMDDDRPRRTTGRIGTGGGADADRGQGAGLSSDDNSPSPPAEADPSFGGGGAGESDPTVVLADVVDSSTLDALRRAESSGDPRARAKAANRARTQVQSRLETLRKQRVLIERRAKALRR